MLCSKSFQPTSIVSLLDYNKFLGRGAGVCFLIQFYTSRFFRNLPLSNTLTFPLNFFRTARFLLLSLECQGNSFRFPYCTPYSISFQYLHTGHLIRRKAVQLKPKLETTKEGREGEIGRRAGRKLFKSLPVRHCVANANP